MTARVARGRRDRRSAPRDRGRRARQALRRPGGRRRASRSGSSPARSFALLGPNGAGKTTTVEILEGYRRADDGHGPGARRRPGARRSRDHRARVGLMLQGGGGIDPRMTAREVAPTPRRVPSLAPAGRRAALARGTGRGGRPDALPAAVGRRAAATRARAGARRAARSWWPSTSRRRAWTSRAGRRPRELLRALRGDGVTVLLTSHDLVDVERRPTASRSSTAAGSSRWGRRRSCAAARCAGPLPAPTPALPDGRVDSRAAAGRRRRAGASLADEARGPLRDRGRGADRRHSSPRSRPGAPSAARSSWSCGRAARPSRSATSSSSAAAARDVATRDRVVTAAPAWRATLAMTAMELRLDAPPRRERSSRRSCCRSSCSCSSPRSRSSRRDDRRPVDFLLPGSIALAIVATSLVSLGITTAYDRSYGVLKRLGGSPLSAAGADRREDPGRPRRRGRPGRAARRASRRSASGWQPGPGGAGRGASWRRGRCSGPSPSPASGCCSRDAPGRDDARGRERPVPGLASSSAASSCRSTTCRRRSPRSPARCRPRRSPTCCEWPSGRRGAPPWPASLALLAVWGVGAVVARGADVPLGVGRDPAEKRRTPVVGTRGSGGVVGCGERIRTSDLRVMSPTSCRCSTPRPRRLPAGPGSVKRRTADLRLGVGVRRRPGPERDGARPATSSPAAETDDSDHDGREEPERQPDVDLGEDAGDQRRGHEPDRPGRRRRGPGRSTIGRAGCRRRRSRRAPASATAKPVASTRISGTASPGSA